MSTRGLGEGEGKDEARADILIALHSFIMVHAAASFVSFPSFRCALSLSLRLSFRGLFVCVLRVCTRASSVSAFHVCIVRWCLLDSVYTRSVLSSFGVLLYSP